MPGYVSYIGGVAAGGDGTVAVKRRVMLAAVLFVLGLASTFTLLGAAASGIGGLLLAHRQGLIRVAGMFVILMGLMTMGLMRIPFLQREARIDLHRVRRGTAGAYPLGVAFAIGWTPCIGPVLAGILTAAASTQQAGRGAALLFAYSLGLGIPFLLLARLSSGDGRLFRWLRRHGRALEVVGGLTLVLMGVLMFTGYWLQLFTPLVRFFSKHRWPPI